MRTIEEEIVAALDAQGVCPVRLQAVYAPAWTTDWLTDDAKGKLEEYGIAPPGPAPHQTFVTITSRPRAEAPPCPYCRSRDTALRSPFGSTACKSICYCNACRQPFEALKAI
jgi:ring-1,2-phenylacetyl-CoA epoxidase subunit PaaD